MNTCPDVLAIIVTHDSASVLPLCLESLTSQEEVSLSIIVVDSGSSDCGYLHKLQGTHSFTLVKEENIGFSKANNRGYQSVESEQEFVVFLNPDTILPKRYLHQAVEILQCDSQAAIVSGILEGYDPVRKQPTGLLDSTGIFRKWYGRWYDRNQGESLESVSLKAEEIPAICGALMVCRKNAMEELGQDIFDPDFFLYKEDIELSLRLRQKGFKLLFMPQLHAFHCRGWNTKRSDIPLQTRLAAARSEILLYRKHPSPYMIWALVKYVLVRWFSV